MSKVLIADDDPLIRQYLIAALEHGGHEVVAAADGAQAIEYIHDEPGIDVVVTDYSMPRSNGIDVITHARSFDPTLPCVIVTAFRDLDLAMRGMQAGAVGFIPKPFKAEHLLTVIQRAIERRALETEAIHLRLLAPMLERFTMLLASTLESKDLATQRHSERLAKWADRIGVRLGLGPDERSRLRLGASLHDIGKVGVPEHILNKTEPLLDEELAQIRRHPDIGADILARIDAWDDVRLIVRHHHEHYGGGGYPDGLRGEAIPLGARIVCVVDAFDVMRSGRVYCQPRLHDEILSELHELRGVQFDPDVVEAFIACLDADPEEPETRPLSTSASAGTTSWLLPDRARVPASD